MVDRPLWKCFKKKLHDKAVQSNILWPNLKKIQDINILQSAGELQGNLF